MYLLDSLLNKSIKLIAIVMMLFLVAGCKQTLYGDLGEQEANEMLAILLDNCIAADKQPGKKGRVILNVDEKHLNTAVNALTSKGYPKEARFANLGNFDDSGMITSPSQEEAKQIFRKSQDISFTLTKIDGVVEARAHIVLAEEDKLGRHVSPASVGILIKHVPGVNIKRHISKIKSVVQHGVPGVNVENISIALIEAEVATEDGAYSQCVQDGGSVFSKPLFWVSILLLIILINLAIFFYWKHINSKKSA